MRDMIEANTAYQLGTDVDKDCLITCTCGCKGLHSLANYLFAECVVSHLEAALPQSRCPKKRHWYRLHSCRALEVPVYILALQDWSRFG